ncbi:MAG: type II toxin-antitoxin system HicB family antitoxin [Roseburia sp.]|nr:type II toxin-antitoxin system HicB family antitoxin [Roseburia sp.]
MKYCYTATFVPNEDGTKYYCRVPDLPGCITTGSSIDDAIELIIDAASGWLVVAEDEGNEIPAATPQHILDIPENATCSLIRVDTLAYRAATDTRAVRKNVSLPAWMAALAEKRGVNCSQVLQDGLMQLLNASTTNIK